MKIFRVFGYFFLMAMGILTFGCEDYLDVNQDPSAPPIDQIDESVILPGLLGKWAYSGTGNVILPSTYWHLWQISNFGGNPPLTGGVNGLQIDATNSGAAWELYNTVLKHAIDLEEKAMANGNDNYLGIGQLIEAVAWFQLVDTYGDIPYDEAFQYPEILKPEYDDDAYVYAQVLELVDDALTNLQSAQQNTAVQADDFVYRGDMDKWVRLAYSLKARYLLRLVYAPDYDKNLVVDQALAAISKGMQSNDDEANFDHYSGTGQEAYWYTEAIGQTGRGALTPSVYLVDSMVVRNDPRLPVYFTKTLKFDDYRGWDHNGSSPNDSIHSFVSIDTYTPPDGKEVFMSYVEHKLIEAELHALKQDFANSETSFREAITADMERSGIDQAATDNYLAQFTFPQEEEAAIEFIIRQKYVAIYLENDEMRYDYLRTGYPSEMEEVLSVVNSQGFTNRLPRRLPWPQEQYETNPNTPEYNGEAYENRVFWDAK